MPLGRNPRREKLREFSARGTPRDPRGEAMDTTRFRRDYTPRGEHPLERIMADTSAANVREKKGLRASIDEISGLSEGVRTVENIGKKYLPGLLGLGQRMTTGAASAWNEAQEARRDDKKWTLGGDPLDITRGTPAYKWLLDDIIQPEYKDDFRREVEKNNLHWTELNKYAGDKAVGLAPRINLLNDPSRFEDYGPVQQANYLESIMDPNWENVSTGIEDSAAGRRALDDYINAGVAMEGEGMIADAAADAANKRITSIPKGLTTLEQLALNPDPYYDSLRELDSETTVSPFPDDDYLIGDNVLFDQFADEPQNIETAEDRADMWSIIDTFPQLGFIKNPSLLPQNLDKPLEEMTQQEAALWAARNPNAAMNLGWNPYQ